MKAPDPRLHKIISILKSGIRIGGTFGAIVCLGFFKSSLASSLLTFLVFFAFAEIIGIIEELV